MYTEHFGLTEKPFSISPDPRYLYLSRRHADALAHLLYGISESGGFIQLTGEVGTGKTTLIRSLLEQLPDKTEIALVLNPPLTTQEFLVSICQELRIDLPAERTIKALIDRLNEALLAAHAEDRRVVLIVDEAQTLSPELLEQIRLLTNLETAKRKLLQIILIGQPELREILARPDMRQIAQRITGRYHLRPLSAQDARVYIRHRMRVAGSRSDVFTERAMRKLYRLTGGIPRLINVIADRALLAAYTREERSIGAALIRRAAREVCGGPPSRRWAWLGTTAAGVLAAIAVGAYFWPVTPPASTGASGPPAIPATALAPQSDAALPQSGNDATATARIQIPGVAMPTGSQSPLAAAAVPLGDFLFKHAAATGELTAAATLLRLWGTGLPVGSGAGCERVTADELSCLALTSSSLHELRQINRPAVLELDDGQGRVHHVVITGLGYDYAVLAAGESTVRVSIADLTHYWFGTHWLLWQPQTEVSESLRPGMRSERVRWLRGALRTIRGEEAVEPALVADPSADPAFFDSVIEGWVREYQLSKRLDVDGVVGKRTQVALQADLGHLSGPTLAEAN